MDRSTEKDNKHFLALRSAMTALSRALDADEQRAAERALTDAGVTLQEQVWARELWLQRNWDRMEDYKLTLPPDEYEAKDAIYRAKIAEYEIWHQALGEALLAIGRSTFEIRQETLTL